MRKIAISLFFLLAVSACLAFGQSLQKASASFNEFVRLSKEKGNSAQLYDCLYDAYIEYFNIAETFTKGSAFYVEAKSKLRSIQPYLQNGAAYHSTHGNAEEALKFAKAFIDLPLSEIFSGEQFPKDSYYPTMAYFAASNSYNLGDFSSAVKYFKEYLTTGDKAHKKEVYVFMSKALSDLNRKAEARLVIKEAVQTFPEDPMVLTVAVNNAIDLDDKASLAAYSKKLLDLNPGDIQVMSILGKAYEDMGRYDEAAQIFTQLRLNNPRNLQFAKHLAVNIFNQGVTSNNKSLAESDTEVSSKYEKEASGYFEMASTILEEIRMSDSSSSNFLEALAVAYIYLGKMNELIPINEQLASMGLGSISSTETPKLMTYDSSPASNYKSAGVEEQDIDKPFSIFAKQFVEKRIEAWQKKDQFETLDEYRARVNERNRDEKVKAFLTDAEEIYLKAHPVTLTVDKFTLLPYDPENEVFLAQSEYGDMIIPVPRANNEAKIFESDWSGMQLANPVLHIINDKYVITAATLHSPSGKDYSFDNSSKIDYVQNNIKVSFNDINYGVYIKDRVSAQSHVSKKDVYIGMSEVDNDLPPAESVNDKTFAVIIANENYHSVANVPMSLNDGNSIKNYCRTTLGIPENHIRYYPDATFGTMISAMNDMKNISDAYSGDISFIFYYSGHGIPDVKTRDAFLLPVDAAGRTTAGCYSLKTLYRELGALNATKVVALFDSCFSGSKRDGGMLESARGVALAMNEEPVSGKLIVLSAASGDETALPYDEEKHGMFTYFLLKILKESKGAATLAEISDYIICNVRQQSIVINKKPQTPTVRVSNILKETWRNMHLCR